MLTPFKFYDSIGGDASPEKFFLEVPGGIQSKGGLLDLLAKAGKFPEYFGGNWDSLLDCLRDFGWIHEKQIVIMHSDVPLNANPVDCRIYLETLREAVDDWTRSAGQSEVTTEASVFPNHELLVLFPEAERGTVTKMLTS